jgi:hypothetical protein
MDDFRGIHCQQQPIENKGNIHTCRYSEEGNESNGSPFRGNIVIQEHMLIITGTVGGTLKMCTRRFVESVSENSEAKKDTHS